jgi:hypothetical protein
MSNEYARYSRLVGLASRWDTEDVDFDEHLWASLYEYGHGDVPEPDQIAEIDRLWATSPEGYGSTDIAFIARLSDGRWATCVAWSDTSGFGCREDVDWRINDSRETAISKGLDKEARAHLGLSLPGEGAGR